MKVEGKKTLKNNLNQFSFTINDLELKIKNKIPDEFYFSKNQLEEINVLSVFFKNFRSILSHFLPGYFARFDSQNSDNLSDENNDEYLQLLVVDYFKVSVDIDDVVAVGLQR